MYHWEYITQLSNHCNALFMCILKNVIKALIIIIINIIAHDGDNDDDNVES